MIDVLSLPMTRYGSENSYDPRLREVLVYTIGQSHGMMDPRSILKLHDHKGQLSVYWRSVEEAMLYAGYIVAAWEWVGECTEHVDHFVPNTFQQIDPIALDRERRFNTSTNAQ